MTYHTYDDYGFYAGTSELETERSTTVAPPEDEPGDPDAPRKWNWNHVKWVGLPNSHPMPDKTRGVHAQAPAPVFAKPTPPQFKLLLMSAERVALRALRTEGTDHVLNDFFDLIDDPRLTEVDLNLPSVQEAVGYLITLAAPFMVPAYAEEDVARRVAEVMAGTLK